MDQEVNQDINKKFVFHWGYAITVFFICYVLYLVFLVFKSKTMDHSLVMDNYYQHDLDYQTHYDKITNRKLLGQDLLVVQNKEEGNLIFNFGVSKQVHNLKIEFYRPSDARLDFSKEYKEVNSPIRLSTNNIAEGKWTIKVHWSDDKLNYFKEEEFFIGKS